MKIAIMSIPKRYNQLLLFGISSVFCMVANAKNDIPITKSIILFADNQEHERHGTFTALGGAKVDLIAKVGNRSPRVDVYTKYAMAHILDNYQKEDPPLAIHLGDMLDISCRSEWNRVFSIMKPAIQQNRLAFGLGNHDGFHVGNYAFKDEEKHWFVSYKSWRDRCDAGNMTLDDHKRPERMIWDKTKILNEIKKLSTEKDFPEFKQCFKGMECQTVQVNNNWKVYLQNVKGKEAKYGVGAFWRAFMVSEVTLPAVNEAENIQVKMIILDSSQSKTSKTSSFSTIFYGLLRPSILYGHILEEQRQLVEKLIQQDCPKKECLYIIAGHHPYKDFGMLDGSKKWLSTLLTKNKQVLPLYLSAHTHDGYIDKNRKGFTELNIGALIENEPNFRTLQVLQNKETGKYSVDSHYFLLQKYLQEQSKCAVVDVKSLTDKKIDAPLTSIIYSNQYKNKIENLNHSRKVFIAQLEAIKSEAEKGNSTAQNVWGQKNLEATKTPPITNILEQMRNVKNRAERNFRGCPVNGNSIQSGYRKEDNYKNGDAVLDLLKEIDKHFIDINKSFIDDCDGANNDNTKNHYLAYDDAFFLGFLQDWLEAQPKEALPADYQVCHFIEAIQHNDQDEIKKDPKHKDYDQFQKIEFD